MYNGYPELQQLRIKETERKNKRKVRVKVIFYSFSPHSDNEQHPAAPLAPARGFSA